MTKAIWGLTLGLGIVLALSDARAQPAPPKTPKPEAPKPDAPKPDAPKPDSPQGEKAGKDESLQKGGGNRPWAVGVSANAQKAAVVKFREGNDQLNQGLFARASETYRAALKDWDHPAIHYNLALSLMPLDQPLDAYEALKKAIKYGDAPLEKDKLEHAKEYMLLLERQIASIEVSCDKIGAKVSVDGKEVFVAPGSYKARVRIGRHTFVADKKGYTTRINAPFIGPGESFRIELKLYTAEELTRYTRRWDATWMPYTVLGAGVGAGLLGVVLELAAQGSYNQYDREVLKCNVDNQGCPTDAKLTSIRDSGDSKKQAGYISYGVAGVAVSAGIVLAILNRPRSYQIRPEDLKEEQQPSVSVAPIISPNLTGAMVQGHF